MTFQRRLTPEQVSAIKLAGLIRARYQPKKMAREFGVTVTTINQYMRRAVRESAAKNTPTHRSASSAPALE